MTNNRVLKLMEYQVTLKPSQQASPKDLFLVHYCLLNFLMILAHHSDIIVYADDTYKTGPVPTDFTK